jgi:hypothetical protein
VSRFVLAAPVNPALASSSGDKDDYLTRIAKYVPTEIVAAYVFLNGLLISASAAQLPGERWLWYLAAFVLCWVLTPLYLLRRAAPVAQPRRMQVVLSTVAFPIWAYAVGGGLFVTVASGVVASVLLVVFSLVSGLFEPKAGDP